MAWTDPRTWSDGELVTATIMNAHVKDNLNHLMGAEVSFTTTGNIDDLDFSNVSLIRMNNATDATLRGMLAGRGGQVVMIVSVGAGNVYLSHENTNEATAVRRLNNSGYVTVTDLPLVAGKGRAAYQYDDTTDRWRLISYEMGSYLSYSPAWSSSGTAPDIGNGTIAASYYIAGDNVYFQIIVVWGSTTSGGTGNWTFAFPMARVNNTLQVGNFAVDTSTGNRYLISAEAATDTTFYVISNVTNLFTATVPFTWTTSDQLNIVGWIRGV